MQRKAGCTGWKSDKSKDSGDYSRRNIYCYKMASSKQSCGVHKKDQIWGVSQNIVKKFRKNSLQKFDIIDHMQ